MAFRTAAVTLTDTPTVLIEAAAGDLEIWVCVDQSNADWYIGGADVTTSTGYHLVGGAGSGDSEFHTEIRPGDVLYGVVPTGFVTANVLVRSA